MQYAVCCVGCLFSSPFYQSGVAIIIMPTDDNNNNKRNGMEWSWISGADPIITWVRDGKTERNRKLARA